MRLFVVAGSAPLSSLMCEPSRSTAAQPPSPGFPSQPPSVWIVTRFNRSSGGGNAIRRRLRRREVAAALGHALEEFVAFAQAANADILVFEHRLDDAENRFRTQVIAAVKLFHVLENLIFAQAGVFERALLEAIALDEVGLVLLGEPAVEPGLLVKFGAGIRRGERDLHGEHIQFLREADGLLDGLAGLDRQAEDERAG